MSLIAQAGGMIKYGHNEVGNFTNLGMVYEQNEIEFTPVNAFEAANHLMLAKWIIRTAAARRGLDVTFAPKISVGKAGSGLHIHFKLMKDGKNMMMEDGHISEIARKAIAGILTYAPALTAFGNRVPTSYLRLVPHQEAPTSICWGDRNRSVLVRVPLGWTGKKDMCSAVNPLEVNEKIFTGDKQTVELRSADCSGDVYLLMAGMIVAAAEGINMPDALVRAENMYVSVNIHNDANRQKLESLAALPDSCVASAKALNEAREVFEKNGIFDAAIIDGTIDMLEKYNDAELRETLKDDQQKLSQLVQKYWHCG